MHTKFDFPFRKKSQSNIFTFINDLDKYSVRFRDGTIYDKSIGHSWARYCSLFTIKRRTELNISRLKSKTIVQQSSQLEEELVSNAFFFLENYV